MGHRSCPGTKKAKGLHEREMWLSDGYCEPIRGHILRRERRRWARIVTEEGERVALVAGDDDPEETPR